MKCFWSHKEITFLTKNYPKYGIQYCVKKLKRSSKSIRSQAIRLGVRVSKEGRSQNRSYSSKNNWIKIFKHQNYLYKDYLDLKNPKIVYLLGYLWADGYFSGKRPFTTSIEIMNKDYCDIKDLFILLGKFSFHSRQRPNRQLQTAVVYSNALLGLSLKNYGYKTNRKSFPNKLLNNISTEFRHYWWRGFSDGDGCFYINKKNYTRHYSMCACFDFNWLETKKLFNKLGIKYKIAKRIQKPSKHSVIRISNRGDIVKLGNYLYQNYPKDGIGLKRKYSKFLEIKS